MHKQEMPGVLVSRAGSSGHFKVESVLGQILFPRGNIKAAFAFEEVRQVLEREGLIDTK
jgi:hypothetical protein